MVSWIPAASRPRKAGWKRASGERKLMKQKCQGDMIGIARGNNTPLISNSDNLTIRKLIALLKSRGLGSRLELLIEIEGNVTQLLFDVTNDFTFGGGSEGVTSFCEVLDEEIG